MAGLVTRFGAALAGLVMLAGAALAQEEPAPVLEPWQQVITSQIEAFRNKDAPGAFQYAGAGFQVMFPSAEAFFIEIISSGYAPIMESRSHSFGPFQVLADKAVVQEVRFVGNDQALYDALYQLIEEPVGWRVQAVQLVKQPGVGI